MFKTDELNTTAAVSESQNSKIEIVSWQVRLTDQVRYHQRSSSVFVGARLDGLLAPPALKLKNWKKCKICKSIGNRGWDHTHTKTHTQRVLWRSQETLVKDGVSSLHADTLDRSRAVTLVLMTRLSLSILLSQHFSLFLPSLLDTFPFHTGFSWQVFLLAPSL